MAEDFNLATFHPHSAEEFFDGLVTHVASTAVNAWNDAQQEIEPHLKLLSKRAFRTTQMLAAGQITQADADFIMHGQELYLSNVLIYSEFLTYWLAQQVLDAVFAVVKAAFKNVTGFDLDF